MSRNRTVPRHRSRAIVLLAAGAFSVATAASAAAATLAQPPPGSPAVPVHDASPAPHPAVPDGRTGSRPLAQASTRRAQRVHQVRGAAADLAAAHWQAAHQQAAGKAAAARAMAPSGSPQQVAAAMLGSFGWSPGQSSCLDPLWQHESGWSVTADNAGTGAYGIPQALPGSRMAGAGPDWQTDAATQIRWGLDYIRDTYGSPCAAWDHEQATGWY